MNDSDVIDITDEVKARQNAERDTSLTSKFIDLTLERRSSSSTKRKVADVDLTTDKMDVVEDVVIHRPNIEGQAKPKTMSHYPHDLTIESALTPNAVATILQSSGSESQSSRDGPAEKLSKRQKITPPAIEITDYDELSSYALQGQDERAANRSLENRTFSDTSKYTRPGIVVEDEDDKVVISSDEEPALRDKERHLGPLIGLEESRVIIDLLDADDARTPVTEIDISPIVTDPIKVSKNGIVFTCAAGRTIEFKNGTFMKIEKIIYDSQKQIVLIGKFLIRQNSFDAKVPKRRNEVVWLIDGNEADWLVDGVERRSIKPARRIYREVDILRNRKLIMTNRPYPRIIDDVHHPRRHPDSCSNPTDDVECGPLFCRMKHFCKTQRGRRDSEEIWQALSEDEADDDARVDSNRTRLEWRGPTVLGGSAVEFAFEQGQSSGELVQAYTFGDSFCGAGGTSCGARKAGLHIMWSFDADPKPLETYRSNFLSVDCHEMFVHKFVEHARGNDALVDILHLSPPCQPFSPAHTVSNAERDEPNQAALLSVGSLLEVVKPRVVTLEQTLGLESRHPDWFQALIHDFVRAGYSFHWKVVNCADYGVPQTRKRLIFLGAGPGEVLPDFPQPTHGVGEGLIPLDTIRNVLEKVTPGAQNHDPTRLMLNPKPPYSPDTTAKTVTCNGGVGNYHPSGLRKFTVREFACFQTFPLDFKLADVGLTQQRKQVGNAVPPLMAETIYKAIIRSLKESDGVI